MLLALLGYLLRGVHADPKRLAWNHTVLAGIPETISLYSDSFSDGAEIPLRHAGKGAGENVSPPLSWTGIPSDTEELVIVIEDPDAPLRRPFVHLIAYGLDPARNGLLECALSGESLSERKGGVFFGRNTFGSCGYQGPRPLPSHGQHCYLFQIFALKRHLPPFRKQPTLSQLMKALSGIVIARGRLKGTLEQR